MDKFHIKKVSEVDEDKLSEFYQNSFKQRNSNNYDSSWRYRLGFNNYEPLVIEIDRKIRGHAGLIANKLKLKDEIKTGIWFTDFYIDKKYRSLGYGKLLTKAWMEICPIQITLCNESSLKIFKKLDWSYNNKFIKKLKIHNFLNFIPVLQKSYFSEIKTNNLGNLKLQEIDDKTIYNLAYESEKSLSKKNFGIVRDENWFKWRLLDCPYKKNILVFRHDNNYILTSVKVKKRFKILNIIYSSKPVTKSILYNFDNFIKNNKINFISFISRSNTLLNIDLPWRRKLNFACYAEKMSEKDFINQNFDDLQFIDGDMDFI